MLLLASFQVLFLGSLYTLSRKYQNLQMSPGMDSRVMTFHHPMFQVFCLFAGMAICLPLMLFVKKEKTQKKTITPLVMLVPSLCDVLATIFDATGLIYTHVSVHQMLKGFIVLFTALISYIVFKRKFTKLQMFGISSVIIGLLLVGLCNIHSYNPKFAPRPILGNSLVILGQFFLAGMFVYEEKILKEYDVHVFEIVGWEGVWGMLISIFFMSLFYIIPGRDHGSWENPVQAAMQIGHNMTLLLAILCSSFVIGPFNYFGTNLTKYSSAMHRCLIDASRMCVVWLISICCGWEHFKLQQSAGYIFVLLGNLIYYEIIKMPESQENPNQQLPTLDNESKNETGLIVINVSKENEPSLMAKLLSRWFKRSQGNSDQSKQNEIMEEKDLLREANKA